MFLISRLKIKYNYLEILHPIMDIEFCTYDHTLESNL